MFHVRTEARIPLDLDPEVRADLLQRDRDHLAEHLVRRGATIHRAVGAHLDFMLIEASDAASLHTFLVQRPVARYARVEITALRS